MSNKLAMLQKNPVLILGVVALILSRVLFFFFNDPEGPNLLIVIVTAVVIAGVSLVTYAFSSSQESPKRFWIAITAQLLVVALAWVYSLQQAPTSSEPQVPPQPQTETPLPPSQTTETGAGKFVASLGQTVSVLGEAATLVKVLEDSRCPTDVQCIQAGTVRLEVILKSRSETVERVFSLGELNTVHGGAMTLVGVSPTRVSTMTLHDTDYRFEFSVHPFRGL